MTSRTLSARQRRRLREAIRDGHLAFLAEVFGPAAVDRDDYDRLRVAGKIRDEKLLPQDAVLAAHLVGAAAGHALSEHPAGEAGGLLDFVGDDLGVITEAEREAVSVLRDRVAEHVSGLSGRLEEAIGHAVVSSGDAARRGRLASRASGGPRPAPPPAADLLAKIRVAAAILRRDWVRVAHTVVHDAAEEVKAAVLAGRAAGRDPRVFKRVHPDACSFCALLYLRPDGVTPRVFRLSALIANGSNAGRRAGRPVRSGRSRTEWKAVVGAAHPFCQCELAVLPDGMGFDARGKMTRVGAKKSLAIEVEGIDADLAAHDCEGGRS